ncbi:MAG TPA: BadF/BadG/BcrA/BcrD ATPase family protein [Steroidobacteraceae bacterium]|nr:BadF/BadG/BcrA/BcrD ATPase family protein [Steroidobacteraceae bacterium]
MKTYLGVDGGGSKTLFLLIDEQGQVLGTHTEGPAYHLEIGLESLEAMLSRGIGSTLQKAGMAPSELTFAFLGVPAYGEDRSLQARLDAAPAAALPAGRYRCGNDVVCGWAGALAGADGINIVAGTGSIAYGEYSGRSARAGGWGELFSDEGSAHWLAREGLRLFSRMSDGRAPRSALYGILRRHLSLEHDLDLCAAVYGKSLSQRSQLAQLSRLVAEAATAGDSAARELFTRAVVELADIVDAVRDQLRVPADLDLPLSYSGGLFQLHELLLEPFEAALAARARRYRLSPARLPPDAGAALQAARLAGAPLPERSIAALEARLRRTADV